MNKKDCEQLAYLLSVNTPVNWHLCERIFDMDERIEPEYELFQEAQGESDEILELTENLMMESNMNFSTNQNLTRKTYIECLDEARRTVLGDDYDPSLFRKG